MDRSLKRRLEDKLGDLLQGPVRHRHDNTEIHIEPGAVPEALRRLHDDQTLRFEMLVDLCGADTGEHMQAIYHLWSDTSPDWLRVVAEPLARDDPRVPSVTFLWLGAEWFEREAYDMFGIVFEGNRDLRRILMPPDYQSYPLRKDFYLPDDAARSPGAGERHVEVTHPPADFGPGDESGTSKTGLRVLP